MEKNEPYTGVFSDNFVEEYMDSSICTAYVKITSPVQKTISKQFTINAQTAIGFDIITCKTSPCTRKSKIFILGEDIHIEYVTDAENPSIEAMLILPDGTTKQIDIPATVKSEQTGTYELSVTASKKGYRTMTENTQFGVIESEADIPYSEIGGEDDVLNFDYMFLSAAVIALLAVVIGVFLYRKRSRTVKNKVGPAGFEPAISAV